MSQEADATLLEWAERSTDELADRYGSFYGRLVNLYHILPEHAAMMASALIGAEQMPRFEGLLPEIEFSVECDDLTEGGGAGRISAN